MKNKKGFTLVELLAVIVILGLLMTIAVPSVLTFSENMKKNMFCTKVETIEKAAQLYGEDNFDSLSQGSLGPCEGGKCYVNTNIEALLKKGYLKKEENEETGDNDEFYNPIDNTSMKNDFIRVYIVNKRVHAKYVFNSKTEASMCENAEYYFEGRNIRSYSSDEVIDVLRQ